MCMKKDGALIAIEGIDAVGKRTQSSLLEASLRSRGFAVSTMSFPDYGTDIGREIRRFFAGEKDYPPEAIHMLLAANRWEDRERISSSLSSCDLLLINRYSGSNLAYGTANGLKLDWLVGLEAGLPGADLVCVLDAAPQTIVSRRERKKDRYERNSELQERARQAYLDLAPQFGWRIVDASRDIVTTSRALLELTSALLTSKVGRTV